MTDLILPRFVRMEGSSFRYSPPHIAVVAGAVKRKSSRSFEEITKHANFYNEKYVEWMNTRIETRKTYKEGRVTHLINSYLNSMDYASLTSGVKKQYNIVLHMWQHKRIGGVEFFNAKIDYITAPLVQRLYEQELKSGSRPLQTNQIISVHRAVWNWGIRHGFTTLNPFSHIKKISVAARKMMWKRSQVLSVLNTAFSKWEWRSAGIIFYCLYEWGQRVSDILNLRWSAVDLKNKTVTIQQSKKGVTVRLPISDGLANILQQQYKEHPCRTYVAPRNRSMSKRDWVPYNITSIMQHYREIGDVAGIPKELQLRDLRRTAITEVIENGGDLLTVMMMSGHQSAASVSPYFVHTLKGSTKAQQIREFPSSLINPNILKETMNEKFSAIAAA
jgi:integrase